MTLARLQYIRPKYKNEVYFCMLATNKHSSFKDTIYKSIKKQEILRDKYDEGLCTGNYYTC